MVEARNGQRPRCKSPGRAHCQLNYPRGERVVELNVLETVKAARRDVLEHYKADIMGVRGPQWTNSSCVSHCKHTQSASDESLANNLLPSSFIPSDLRRTKSCNQQYNKQRYHAFTRGDCTPNWNHSTEISRRQQRILQQQLDAKASAATLKRKQQVTSYVSPVAREEQFASNLRSVRQQAAATESSLVQQYGPEGAAAMKFIMRMKVPDRQTIVIQVTREELTAVEKLPAMSSESDLSEEQ